MRLSPKQRLGLRPVPMKGESFRGKVNLFVASVIEGLHGWLPRSSGALEPFFKVPPVDRAESTIWGYLNTRNLSAPACHVIPGSPSRLDARFEVVFNHKGSDRDCWPLPWLVVSALRIEYTGSSDDGQGGHNHFLKIEGTRSGVTQVVVFNLQNQLHVGVRSILAAVEYDVSKLAIKATVSNLLLGKSPKQYIAPVDHEVDLFIRLARGGFLAAGTEDEEKVTRVLLERGYLPFRLFSSNTVDLVADDREVRRNLILMASHDRSDLTLDIR